MEWTGGTVMTAVVERLDAIEAEKDEGALVISNPSHRHHPVAICRSAPGRLGGWKAHCALGSARPDRWLACGLLHLHPHHRWQQRAVQHCSRMGACPRSVPLVSVRRPERAVRDADHGRRNCDRRLRHEIFRAPSGRRQIQRCALCVHGVDAWPRPE